MFENFIKELGNIEFLSIFWELYNMKYNRSSNIYFFQQISEFLENYDINILYNIVFNEAKARGLDADNTIVFNDSFHKWEIYMKLHPTYIREVRATNYLGDMNIFSDTFLSFLDFPVRESCKILYEKGYKTYWSSANREDYFRRKGDIIDNKAIAYILIDPECLNDTLKGKLLLECGNVFWGIADENYGKDGEYYGIWEEITSENMPCNTLSNRLKCKALELPVLTKQKIMHI